MKKLLIVAFILSISSMNFISAQSMNGMTNDALAIKERQKSKIIEDLKLSDEQANFAINVQQEFKIQYKGLRGLYGEDRATKIKEINRTMYNRLKEFLKNEQLIQDIMEYFDNQNKQLLVANRFKK